MNLILDQGNTTTKIVLTERGEAVFMATYTPLTAATLNVLIDHYHPDRGILSSVAEPDPAWLPLLRRRLRTVISLNDDPGLRIPLTIDYLTPETLGRDRIAAAVGARTLRRGAPLLVIDAGTAITYDLVLASGRYLGGNISPGLTTRFRALNYYTRRLPLVHERDDVPRLGTTTETAILSGVVRGIVYEMNGYITDLRSDYPNLVIFLTGGHAFYFEGRLKCATFASENLVWIGLNRILEYNVDDK